MTQPLFRPDALAATQAQQVGQIRIGRNPRFLVVAVIAALLASIVAAYAVWGRVARTARLPGLLVPTLGLISVTAPQAGTLHSVLVAEGDAVREGDPLAIVGTDRSTSRGDVAVLVQHSLEQRRGMSLAERVSVETQWRQRDQSLDERARSLVAEQGMARSDIAALQRRVAFARRTADRYAELAASGFVADVQAQQKQEELIDLGSRLSSAERALAALVRDVRAVTAERKHNAHVLQQQLTQIDRSLAALDQEAAENEARQRIQINAPRAGSVGALPLRAGAAVHVGQTLATILPSQAGRGSPEGASTRSELRAELYGTSGATGFVQVGQPVWLRYAAYPYQKFGMARATVANVSHTPIKAQDLPEGQAQSLARASQSDEPLYRIVASLARQDMLTYGESRPLRAGMALEADIQLDHRAIWEWLFEPVLAARALSGRPAGDGPR
jgi:membrane fusion protein